MKNIRGWHDNCLFNQISACVFLVEIVFAIYENQDYSLGVGSGRHTMTKNELEQYRAELVAERQTKIDAVNSQYQRKLEALGILIDDQPELQPIKVVPTKVFASKAANVMQAVREAIAEKSSLMGGMSGRFTSETLLEYIKAKYPGMAESPSNLSGPLWRLKKAGEIEVFTKGTGRTPSAYQKTAKFNSG